MAGGNRQVELLRHVLDQLRQHKFLRLQLDPAMFQARQLKQLLGKRADFIPLAQRNIEIALALFRTQPIGFQRQRLQITEQRSQRSPQIVRNIGDKFTPLAIAIGQSIPLPGDLPGQVDKPVMQDRHFIAGMRIRRLRRQQFNRSHAVFSGHPHLCSQLAYRARHPIPGKTAGQQTKQGHQQQRPDKQASQRLLPGAGRQLIKGFPLQDNIEIAAQLAVDIQRRHAEDLALILATRIVTVHRPGAAGEKRLYRHDVNALAFDMARRRSIGQQLAVR